MPFVSPTSPRRYTRSEFLRSVGVNSYLLCEELNYNGQRRRDVPDLATGTLYIDVGDRCVAVCFGCVL